MVQELTRAAFERRELHPSAATEQGLALFTAVAAGVAAQQLGNDQHGDGRYLTLVEPAFEMFRGYYAPDAPRG
jgi:hypothetical protein